MRAGCQVSESDALDGKVVRFATAAGKNHFIGGTAKQLGNLLATNANGFFGRRTGLVGAGWISEHAIQGTLHGVRDLRMYRGAGVVVQVDLVAISGVHCVVR